MIEKSELLHILIIDDLPQEFEIIKSSLNAEIKTPQITRTSLNEAKNLLLTSSVDGFIDLLENHNEIAGRQLLLKKNLSSVREVDNVIRKINSKTEEKGERQY